MPYLHREIEQRLLRMSGVVREANIRNKARKEARKNQEGIFVDVAGDWRIRLGSVSGVKTAKERSWKPQSALGQYLGHVAKPFKIIDEAADERHIT